MPVLTLTISDEAFRLIRTATALQMMADNAHGAPMEAMRKIVAALDRGDSECTISTRAERRLAKPISVDQSAEPSPTPLSGEESR